MRVVVGEEEQSWIGVWPASEHSTRLVAVLADTSHSGLDEVGAKYQRTEKGEDDDEEYDIYLLPEYCRIVR
jgi:hypothetical protein